MTMDDNKKLARRVIGLWASDTRDKPEFVLSEDYLNHQESDVEGGVSSRNLARYTDLLQDYRAAFGDSRVKILMQIAEGDLVATRWEFTATQTGPYLRHPPTNRTISWTGIQIDRIAESKVTESWVDWDMYRCFAGLGLIQPVE